MTLIEPCPTCISKMSVLWPNMCVKILWIQASLALPIQITIECTYYCIYRRHFAWLKLRGSWQILCWMVTELFMGKRLTATSAVKRSATCSTMECTLQPPLQKRIRQNPFWPWNPEETSPEIQNRPTTSGPKIGHAYVSDKVFKKSMFIRGMTNVEWGVFNEVVLLSGRWWMLFLWGSDRVCTHCDAYITVCKTKITRRQGLMAHLTYLRFAKAASSLFWSTSSASGWLFLFL